MPAFTGSPVYAALVLGGIGLGAVYWFFQARDDGRIPLIYLGGLVGAFAGAKLAYLGAEGWLHAGEPGRWALWLSGKSITGALPGGWAGVEITKRFVGYRGITGDRFALLLPVPLALGRLGCLDAGCCRGLDGWPAVPVEIGFQLLMLGVLMLLRARQWLPGQHFHCYLIGYGLFRFAHEAVRATPKVIFGISGYQWISLAVVLAAAVAFRRRMMKSRMAIKSAPTAT